MEIITPFKDAIDAIKAAGGQAFKYCYQCGTCDSVCPWNRVTKFSMRKIAREAAFGVPEIDGEDMWRCTTCGRCPDRCPRGVETMDVSISFRRIAQEAGISPGPVHTVATSLLAEGNPLREQRSTRADWASELGVKTFTEGMEFLYFPCCYNSFDRRMRKATKATVEILNKAGVDFGILGTKETCCGESIRKTGAEDLFKQLAKENIKNFIDAGVKKIVVSSPHCYNAFKKEYAQFKVNFEVLHITEVLFDLIKSSRLKFEKPYEKKITWHDPCYLGRHNGIYDQPRESLKMIPGLELVEMADKRRDSLCCGGGGGRIWMETAKGERFSDLRIKQATDIGVNEIVTACPYCITMLEDSKLGLEDSDNFFIKDITEVIREAI